MSSPNTDNLLPMLLQVALQRAHPSPLPTNYILTLIGGPNDPVTLTDSVTTSSPDTAWQVWGGGIEFSDWASCTLTDASATANPGSLVLTSGSTTGSAVTVGFDLGAEAAPSGVSVAVSWLDNLPSAVVSDTVQVAFSAASTGPWGTAVTVTNGEKVLVQDRYLQATIALASTSTTQTPQFSHLRLYVPSVWTWGTGVWQT